MAKKKTTKRKAPSLKSKGKTSPLKKDLLVEKPNFILMGTVDSSPEPIDPTIKKVILISGKKGSGKSTLSDGIKEYLKSVAPKTNHFLRVYKQNKLLFTTLKYADPLYEAHEKVWDIVDRYKLIPRENKSRDLLQMLGDFGRARDINLYAKITHAEAMKSDAQFVLIDDLRYPSEMNVFPENVLRIRLECSEEIRKERCSVWGNSQHSSETSLDHVVGLREENTGAFDYVFDTAIETVQDIIDTLVFDGHLTGHINNKRVHWVW